MPKIVMSISVSDAESKIIASTAGKNKTEKLHTVFRRGLSSKEPAFRRHIKRLEKSRNRARIGIGILTFLLALAYLKIPFG